MKRVMLDGNGAATEGMRLARIRVVSAYPITPQSPISEKLADYVTDGTLDAKYIRVESEHSAMSCAIGAQLTGVRAGTATASVGLALMHEVLGVAAGCRVPIVMPVVNRSLVSPWSLWCDHQDAMAERDGGWMQFYAESAQEVLDLILIAYKLAEKNDVLLPAMVCLDGFFLSHMPDAVYVPAQEDVDKFLPAYKNDNLKLDPDDPMFINDLTGSNEFMEMRFQQAVAFDYAQDLMPGVMAEFEEAFGRKYSMVEAYECEDAEAVLVSLGSMSGTIKHTVDMMREQGRKVGMLKITSFRPFPAEAIRELIGHVPHIGVIDRSASLGSETGPVCNEVRSALQVLDKAPEVQGFVAGLGGRDVPPTTIEEAFDTLLNDKTVAAVKWLDVQDNALRLREVDA
ncbi:MAG: pyruvate ferredoxin oxidoreductase [Pseudodesulfovibrio sp.]|uniref:Pyruvate ferredoxin oxidoreductase n=1 Tax=Pseudodesulfovibrio indicus TaxID=1716143 RepID=A0A126QJ35_9BACT|nr:pyruvate ferredoxin oxidoreductase [Pseudodesulfovibrio indicus]AMK09990.1 pyruvate ferredoxin oxidoreductase [Pseudodesulfovibrio indicus]TDT87045.1 pyruvate ferredoxin oxidoreductase alpha subunit [Pseudodesulfovibrio indicus]